MSFRRLLSRTATVRPYVSTTDDDFNDEVPGYGTPVDYPAWFEQIGSTEITVGRDTGIVTDRVFLPAGAVISHLSQVVKDDGTVYQVFGPPARVHTPRGEHHVEAQLRGVVG